MAQVEITKGTPTDGGSDKLTKASTAITAGRLVSPDSNGYLIHTLTSVTPEGLAMESKAASDATTTPIQYAKCTAGVKYKFAVSAGTPAQTHVGEYVDLHADGGVDLTASTNDDVLVDEIVSSGYVVGRLKNFL